MSESIQVAKRGAIKQAWGAAAVGAGLIIGTHLTGNHFANEHRNESLFTEAGRPSALDSIEANFGDAEVIEFMVGTVAVGVYGRRALRAGALPRTQSVYCKVRDTADMWLDAHVRDGGDGDFVDNRPALLDDSIEMFVDEPPDPRRILPTKQVTEENCTPEQWRLYVNADFALRQGVDREAVLGVASLGLHPEYGKPEQAGLCADYIADLIGAHFPEQPGYIE
jgi:hypothetical protein